jgi:signal transduction histidine kinase
VKAPATLRGRLTLWYTLVLGALLLIYAGLLFAFQYAVLTRQLLHDEVQDVITVEGLLYFDAQGSLQLHQDYYSRPQSHLLVDRMMEVRDLSSQTLYRSPTLHGMSLGGPSRPGEGDAGFDERIVRLEDGSHVFLVSHLHALNGRTLLIRLGYSLVPLRDSMLQFLLLLIVAVPITLALAALAGQAIARRALQPLDDMTVRAGGITASNLGDRLNLNGPIELSQMARAFNHLLDRLEQAFLQLKRFTADAAHELRTPLAALRTIGEVALEKGENSGAYKDALGNILEETTRLNETIESLLMLARAETVTPDSQRTTFFITELVNEVLTLFGVIMEERQITVIRENESIGRIAIFTDRGLLRVAVLNIIHNAIKFSPEGSTLRVIYSRHGATESALFLRIQDEGPGIAPGEHRRIFDRFFTSASRATAAASGAGLGLSVSKLVIDRLGGNIWFDPERQSGAECVIELPIFEKS